MVLSVEFQWGVPLFLSSDTCTEQLMQKMRVAFNDFKLALK